MMKFIKQYTTFFHQMHKKLSILLLLLSWFFPIGSMIYNQIYPSYESALGVAYGFSLGCFIHLILFILWLIVRRSQLTQWELIIWLSSLIILIGLTVVSSGGALSKLG